MRENARIAEFVGAIDQGKTPRNPTRCEDQCAVARDGASTVPVEVGDIDLAVPPCLCLEGDFGAADGFAIERRDEVIHKSVGLPPQRCAGIAFGHQGVFAEPVGDPAFEIAIAAAAQEILGVVGVGETEALHVKVKLQDLRRLAGKPAQRDPDRRGIADTAIGRDINLRPGRPAQAQSGHHKSQDFVNRMRSPGRQAAVGHTNGKEAFHPNNRLDLTLKLMDTLRWS